MNSKISDPIAKLYTESVMSEKINGNSAPLDNKEIINIIHALQKANLYVDKGETVHISFEEDPENNDTEINRVTYDVYPLEGWFDYVKNGGDNWPDKAKNAAEEFEEIIDKYGYSLGSVGGTPPNFDYQKQYRNIIVTFCFWGNPYHI